MSFSWNVARWANSNRNPGKTELFLGGYMRSTDKLFQALEGTRAKKVEAFKLICAEALRRVKERTPVKTGNAKAAWFLVFDVSTDTTRVKARIENPVVYVLYLEYGTIYMGPRPMLRITLAEVAAEVRAL